MTLPSRKFNIANSFVAKLFQQSIIIFTIYNIFMLCTYFIFLCCISRNWNNILHMAELMSFTSYFVCVSRIVLLLK